MRSSTPIDKPDLVAYAKPSCLEPVEHFDGLADAVAEIALLDKLAQPLLLEEPVDKRQFRGQRLVEQRATDGGVDQLPVDRLHLGPEHVLVIAGRREVHEPSGESQTDGGQRLDSPATRASFTSSMLPNTRPSPLALFFALVK